MYVFFFFFNDTATTEIYTLSLHDALPIYDLRSYLREHEDELSDEVKSRIDANPLRAFDSDHRGTQRVMENAPRLDRKSTRLNSSHANISYAVFCLKKKKTYVKNPTDSKNI